MVATFELSKFTTGSTSARGCFQRAEDLLSLSDDDLAAVDPLVMNLLVAKGIPSLANLDIRPYRQMADLWAADIAR